MATTKGFGLLQSQAKDRVSELTKQLVNPKIMPSEQKIEDVIAIRNEIKGVEWVLEQVEKVKEKSNKEKEV